jgi:hypothetical protein
VGDPATYAAPTGGGPTLLKSLLRTVGLMKKSDLAPGVSRSTASSALNNGGQQASRPTSIASNESLANSPAGPSVIAGNNQTPPSFESFANASYYLRGKLKTLKNLTIESSLEQRALAVIGKNPSLMDASGIPPRTKIKIYKAVNNERIRDYRDNPGSYYSYETVGLARKVKTTNRHIRNAERQLRRPKAFINGVQVDW